MTKADYIIKATEDEMQLICDTVNSCYDCPLAIIYGGAFISIDHFVCGKQIKKALESEVKENDNN